MKFSIVIPVYNVEEYIIKCLESINNQTYKNYEVIIVNDGSPDNCEKLIKKYIKDKPSFKYYIKENGGLSDARNFGIKYITGDYLLYIDSDDYIDKKLLENLNKTLQKKEYDLIKFNIVDVIDGKCKKHEEYITKSREIEINELINFEYFEPVCSYCYNIDFYKKNNFKFKKGRYHEDFGLTPLILIESKSIYYLNYHGYYYVKRENSIVNDKSKEEKKAEDTLNFALENIKIIKEKSGLNTKIKSQLINYYVSSAIGKVRNVDNKKIYLKKLRKTKIHKNLECINIKQRIKKLICAFSYNLYIRIYYK